MRATLPLPAPSPKHSRPLPIPQWHTQTSPASSLENDIRGAFEQPRRTSRDQNPQDQTDNRNHQRQNPPTMIGVPSFMLLPPSLGQMVRQARDPIVDGHKGGDRINNHRNPDGYRDQKEPQSPLMTAKICLGNHENQ